MTYQPVLDVGIKKDGILWNRKIGPNKDDGMVLHITHSIQGTGSSQRQHIRFLLIAIDTTGERLIACNHQGSIFLFDLEKNRYYQVSCVGSSPTAITWNDYRKTEILAAFANFDVRCYNVATKELVSVMKGHTSAVHSLSVHGSGRYTLTSSFDTTILWDLNTFTKKRTLNGAQDVGIQKVFFLPNSNKIVSCFKDDSVFVWNCETMKCLYQLNTPIGEKPTFKCLAASNDCRVLVAGGKSKFLHFWNLDSRQLIQIIELPEKVKEVKHVEFVTDKLAINQNQLIAVLAQDGIIRFIDPHTCQLQSEVGSSGRRVHNFTLSKNSHYLATVLDNGDISLHHLANIVLPKAKDHVVRKVNTTETVTEKTSKKSDKTAKHIVKEKRSDTLKIYNEDSLKDSLYRELPEGLNMKRLKFILSGYGEYPAKYRLFIWRSILQLPENHTSFSAFVAMGTHSAFVNIEKKYPIKSQKLLRVLKRVLSALANWSPIFGEAEYLPLLVFPFVRMFPNNQMICFEIVATILMNWCQKWFEFFPNPPISILSIVEKLLAHHDAALLDHFVQLDVSTILYAWPVLCTLFSEILTKDEWLIAWDNFFTNHPSFMLYFLAAYLIRARKSLLATTCKDDFEYFFHHRNPVDVPAVIKEAYRLFSSTPDECDAKKMLKNFKPLTQGQYPVMDAYPKFVVNYLIEERERIRKEELEYLRQKQVALDIKQHKDLVHQEELAFYRDQEVLLRAEQERRDLIAKEEEKIAKQRRQLQNLRKEVALVELDNYDEVRRKFLQHERLVKNIELQRLDDQLQKKIKERQEEKSNAINEMEVKELQYEAMRRKLEEDILRQEINRVIDGDNDAHQNVDENHSPTQEKSDSSYASRLTIKDDIGETGDGGKFDKIKDKVRLEQLQHEIRALQLARRELENNITNTEEHNKMKKDVRRQRKALLKVYEEKSPSRATYNNMSDISSSSITSTISRGSFDDRQLDLMSQIRDVRLKMAHRNRTCVK